MGAPRNSPGQPVEVRIAKVRVLRAYDTTAGKAAAEAAGQEMAALFAAGSRRRIFRVVGGTPAEGGLVIEGAIHNLDLHQDINGAGLSFALQFGAMTRRGREVRHARVEWDDVPLDLSRNFVPQAVEKVRAAIRREADRFATDCERWVQQGG